jgi:hypothetical protein
MIPFLQLDPSTFTLWANQTLLAECADDAELGTLVSLAYDHRYDDIKKFISLTPRQIVKDTSIRICSEVWHEKRHFLDLVLTNYGSFRWRQTYQTFSNFGSLVKISEELPGDRFGVPLSIYSSKLACKELGLESHPRLEQLGDAQLGLASNLSLDNTELVDGIRVGGDAQLEALAYYFQLETSASVFGYQETLDVLERLDYAKRAEKTHNWAVDLFGRAGLYGDLPTSNKNQETIVEPSPLICLLYGALNGRFHGLDVSREGLKTLPNYRLGALIQYFLENKILLSDIEAFDAAWLHVNEACEKLFGRTILEEIESDMESFESKRRGMLYENIADEYVELRKELFQILSANPERILFPSEYRKYVLPRLSPFLASSMPDGIDGRPDDRFHVLTEIDFANHLPEALHGFVQDERIRFSTHATIAKEWPPKFNANPLGMRNLDSWLPMIDGGAAVVRTLQSGMSWSSMCGLEIIHAKGFIERALGKSVIVERHARPKIEEFDPIEYSFLTGSKTSVCDFTENRFNLEDCTIISPWAFFESEPHSTLLTRHFESLGEWLNLPPQIAHLTAIRTIVKSWSPWVVHREFGWDDDPGVFEQKLALAAYADERNPDGHKARQSNNKRQTFLGRLKHWLLRQG